MGHRANYLLLEPQGSRLFYSHWAAKNVETDLFWGSEQAERFILAQTPCQEWLDDVWCEGGAVLDKVERELVVFGGIDILYDVYRRSVWLTLIAPFWEGWNVRWAARGVVDLAEKAGLSPDRVLAPGSDSRRPVEIVASPAEEDPWWDTLVTLDGRHYTLTTAGEDVLAMGPGLVPRLRAINDPPRTGRHPPRAGLQIETASRTLRYWDANGPCLLDEMVVRSWPGWDVARQDDDCFGHLASLTGFQPESEETQLERILALLREAPRRSASGLVSTLVEKKLVGDRVEVDPRALVENRCEPDEASRSAGVARALRAYWEGPGPRAYPRRDR